MVCQKSSFHGKKTDPHRAVFAEPLINVSHAVEQMSFYQAELLADINLDIEILSLLDKRFSVHQYFRLCQAAVDETGN